jgi:hopene-associated glycosyltransferase HpnB
VVTLPLTAGIFSLSVWAYLLFARGAFWKVRAFDADADRVEPLSKWPSVVAIVPARNEASTIEDAIHSLLKQNYPGQFSVVLVDDDSDDGTADAAHRAADALDQADRIMIHAAAPLPAGWTGKLWAISQGLAHLTTEPPDFFWFTDADVVHAPDTLRRLVSRALRDQLDLASLMVLLQAKTLPERFLIPAFLFFFLKLYPPRWIADPSTRTAGAAGGCILLRRRALERIGGFASIRDEVIDDCALAHAVKRTGGRIWMGLTRASRSIRVYASFAEIERTIARTAFTELRYSALLLAATAAGLALTYFVPVALLFVSNHVARNIGILTWAAMAAAFVPTLRFYRCSPFWAPLLPFIALFYLGATLDSAVRYWLGRGGAWKSRAQAPRRS